MSGGVGFQGRRAFDGGSGVLSEIDHVLAVIGAAHWTAPWQRANRMIDAQIARVLVDRGGGQRNNPSRSSATTP